MNKVLIFSGTTEGRVLSEILAASGIECDVSVATEYGAAMMTESENIRILQGRMEVSTMKHMYNENFYQAVIDATHPYAVEVTKNIKESLIAYNIPYLRLLRDGGKSSDSSFAYYSSVAECVKALKNTTGNILVTTGSKELSSFCRTKAMVPRIYARVLPSVESIETCKRNGVTGKQIIAMQGPFTEETNISQIKQYNISHIVTKESGQNGGEDEKLSAAKKTGIQCHIIERPKENDSQGIYNTVEILEELSRILGKKIKGVNVSVTLVGIGCGSHGQMTDDVRRCITSADYIFGAERMLESVNTTAVQYPYYRKDDIIPVLEQINADNIYNKNVVVLFSGDTGFYSGAANLCNALAELGYADVKILPGISSVAYLAAKVGESYSEANIVSTHGVREEKWLPQIAHSTKYNKKTFFITSGPDDINKIGNALMSMNLHSDDVTILLGYQLSYPDENIMKLSPRQCLSIGKTGLYCGLILNPTPKREIVTPSLRDSDFIRGNVPMTKEEVREVTLCKLALTRDAVFYDIGSGTGSIAVSAAALSPSIDVYALDNNSDALDLVEKNALEAGTFNVTPINATAPDGLNELPMATHAFIGGSKGNLREILTTLYGINPYMRVVMNAVSIESIGEMCSVLKEYKIINSDVTMIQSSRVKEVGEYHMPEAMNPVYIFSFDFTE